MYELKNGPIGEWFPLHDEQTVQASFHVNDMFLPTFSKTSRFTGTDGWFNLGKNGFGLGGTLGSQAILIGTNFHVDHNYWTLLKGTRIFDLDFQLF